MPKPLQSSAVLVNRHINTNHDCLGSHKTSYIKPLPGTNNYKWQSHIEMSSVVPPKSFPQAQSSTHSVDPFDDDGYDLLRVTIAEQAERQYGKYFCIPFSIATLK